MSRWISWQILGLLIFVGASVAPGKGWGGQITCTGSDIATYNTYQSSEQVVMSIREFNDDCFVGHHPTNYSVGEPTSRWFIRNNTANGSMKLHWGTGGTISTLKLDGVGVPANTSANVVGAGPHTITYSDSIDGGRTVIFTVNADGKHFDSTSFTVITTNPAPIITSDGGGATAALSVAENQTAVTDVQSTDTTDSEGSGLTYSLSGGADQAKFSIDTNTGVLTFLTAPDLMNPTDMGANNIYDVQVTVTDSGSITDVQDIAVTVGVGVERTQETIASFMQTRANHILGNQPDLIGYLKGNNTLGGGPLGLLAIQANEENMTLAFSSSLSKVRSSSDKALEQALGVKDDKLEAASSTYGPDENFVSPGTFDVWTEIYGSSSFAGDTESHFWVGYAGAHYFVSPDLIIGAMGQFDWAEENNPTVGSSADGVGWMVGPYLAGRIPGSTIQYEARASWGMSDNNVSPIGTYTDSFETERFMASAKIAGSYTIDNLTITPEARVSWFEETQAAYTDSLSNTIPEQTISLGEVRFGPTFSHSFKLDDGSAIEPSIGISGVWNFGIKENAASQASLLGNDDLRARVDAGISATNAMGWKISASGFMDGFGNRDYEAYGGNINLTIPIGKRRAALEGYEELASLTWKEEVLRKQNIIVDDNVCRIAASGQEVDQWRKKYGDMRTELLRRIDGLEAENQRLRRELTELKSGMRQLVSTASGNY